MPLEPGPDDENIRQQALAKYKKDNKARIEAGQALCGKDPDEFHIIHAVDPGKKAHCFLTLDHGDNAGISRQDTNTRVECRQAHIARYAAERAEAQKSGVSRRSLRGHRRGPAVGSKSNAFFTVAASGHRSQTETTNHVQMAHRRWRRDDDDVTPHTDDTALATALARLYEMPTTWAAKYRKENSGRRSRDREKLRHRQLRWLHRTAKQIAPEGKKTLLLVGSFVKKYMGPRQPLFYGFDPVPIKALFRYLETLTDRVKIHVVNEYGTSKTCSACGSACKSVLKVKKKKKDEKEKEEWGVKRCTNCSCGITWSRDKNAAKNILARGLHELWPDFYLPPHAGRFPTNDVIAYLHDRHTYMSGDRELRWP